MKRQTAALFAISLLFARTLLAADYEGRPAWFPLGAPFRIAWSGVQMWPSPDDEIMAEVYQEADVEKVEKETLSLVPEPRWFNDIPTPRSDDASGATGQLEALGIKGGFKNSACARWPDQVRGTFRCCGILRIPARTLVRPFAF
jgi:hypothetical protein